VVNYNISFRKPLLAVGVSLFGMAGIFYAIAKVSDNLIFIDIYRVITFGIPALAIVISAASIDLNKSLEVPRVFTYIGDASYSIYLIHGPVVSILTTLIAKSNLVARIPETFLILSIITAITAVGISCIFHSFIEKPLIELCRKKLLPERSK
jgi:peptidoglycan/LPS O-acetylase OafA/YrhL